jgi:hypothetical protein
MAEMLQRAKKEPRLEPVQRSSETDALRILLIQRGMNTVGLARLAGFSRGGMSAAIAKSFPHLPARWRVERALGYVPIWSSPKTVRLRRECSERLGFDPFLLNIHELRERARRLPIRGPSDRSKDALVAAIFEHLAANPAHKKVKE